MAHSGHAQTATIPALGTPLPAPADIGRINPLGKQSMPEPTAKPYTPIPAPTGDAPIPAGASNIRFVLKKVIVQGATAFPSDTWDAFYNDMLGKEITLEMAYDTSKKITEHYRHEGYFLSRAYIPEQEIADGIVKINVVEGYVGRIDGVENFINSDIIDSALARISEERPLRSRTLESALLLLNDLPGYRFGGVLSPLEGAKDGAVRLTLSSNEKEGVGALAYDNSSSRFLGPDELSLSYSQSFIPMQETTFTALSDTGRDKLHYGTLQHTITILPELKLELSGGVVHAMPGFTLRSSEIDSISTYAGAALAYQWIRSRDENLALKLSIEGRDITSDILGSPLTRDSVRAIRTTVDYDVSDTWQGANGFQATLSQGMEWLGASAANANFISRSGATPDFTKLEISFSRTQRITSDWSIYGSISGQWASGILYSSEQFGFGGQSFGRAYDTSELTGDRGIKGSVEIRHSGWKIGEAINFQPFGFYDRGAVWNASAGQPVYQLGSSAGAGFRFSTIGQQTGMVGVAWPINRDISTPIYNGSTQGPRVMLGITQHF